MKKMILFFGMAIFLGSCSSVNIVSDVDKDADFNSYKTYTWSGVEQPLNESYPQYDNSLNRKRWKNAIDVALGREGFVLSDNDPDVEIDFHIQFERNAVPNPSYHDKKNDYS